jgi:Uma2 family endonuclease
MTQLLTRYKFTVEEFDRMGEAGIFTKHDRVELIEGEIVEMSPINDPHIFVVNLLNYLLNQPLLQGRAFVQVQSPIRLPPHSEPQPDIVVYSWREDLYRTSPPTKADILFVIEVADTTLAYDRQVKLPLYAAHEIPETWIVNIKGRAVIAGTDPTTDGYGQIRTVEGHQSLSPQAFPDFSVVADELFPAFAES